MTQQQLDGTPVEPRPDIPPMVDTDREIPLEAAGQTLVLVGCGADKADTAQPARDLYRSSYFSLKRDVAELADAWYIISAEHGLLAPDRIIEPYNTEWSTLPVATQQQRVTEIIDDLTPALQLVDRVVFLAGQSYRDPLIDAIADRGFSVAVVSPFEATSGFQDQMQFLAAERDRLTTPNE